MNAIVEEFYRGLNVCVTGGAGMIGSHLVSRLLALGASVTVLDDQSRGSTRFGGAKYVTGNAKTVPSCEYAFRGGRTRGVPVDIVFNLVAAVAGVLYNQNNHHEMFIENVQLQTVPLAVADRMKVPVFLQVSSVCIYGELFQAPSREHGGLISDPVDANAGYSWAKRMGERAIQWSNIDAGIIVRPTNVFGPRDYFDEKAHVIPAMIRKFIEDDTGHVKFHGSPDTLREFIFVTDVAEGMLHAAAFGKDGNAYNLGSGNTVTMGALATMIKLLLHLDDTSIEFVGGDGGDNERWCLSTKACDELGWQAEINLTSGLQETIEWHRSQRDGKKS